MCLFKRKNIICGRRISRENWNAIENLFASKWNCSPNLVISFIHSHKSVCISRTFSHSLSVCTLYMRICFCIVNTHVSARLLLPIVMCSYEAFSIFQVLANLINFDKNPKRRISWLLELNSKSEIECDASPIFGYSFRVVSYPLCYTRHLCDYNIRSNCEKCWWHQRHTHTHKYMGKKWKRNGRANKQTQENRVDDQPAIQPADKLVPFPTKSTCVRDMNIR